MPVECETRPGMQTSHPPAVFPVGAKRAGFISLSTAPMRAWLEPQKTNFSTIWICRAGLAFTMRPNVPVFTVAEGFRN
jgi:hypothetical protein